MALEWRQHPVLRPPTAEEMARMEPKKLVELWELYHEAIENAERDPYRYGFILPHWEMADEQLAKFSEILISGGNRCLAGEQEIYDPVKKEWLRVDSITKPFHVYALDQITGTTVVADAEVPFRKPVQPLYRVSLANGQTLSCSAAHLVLTPSGWKAIGSLPVGSRIFASDLDMPPKSLQPECSQGQCAPTSGTCQSASQQDGERCCQKAQDSQGDCQKDCHSCDGQPRSEADSDQASFPSLSDALGCISLFGSICRLICLRALRLSGRILGALGRKRERIRSYLRCVRLAIRDGLRQPSDPFADIGCRSFCKPCKSALPLFVDRQSWQDDWQSLAVFGLSQCDQQFPEQDTGFDNVFSLSYNRLHYTTIVKCDYIRDGVVWDFTVPSYGNYVAAGIYNHNSGKTSYAAKAVVRAAIENPGSIIMCFSQNADVSVRQQQSAIYDALPLELKRKTLGTEENVSYTRKNGFSKGSLILPESLSQIIFKTYAQFLNNDTILEGAELGSRDPKWLNIGAWCDEYLIGPELLGTLRFRLATRNSKVIITFTPIDGYTEVVRDYIDGAKTIESKAADLLNGRLVPVLQHSKNRNAAIVYFHTKDNPFGGYDRIADDLSRRPEDEILCRAYGVPTKSKSTQFPNFSLETNVIPHDKIPRKNVTRYMVLDPAGRKNWFMAWIAVDESETYYVYREWPDVSVGDWAKWHGGKWIAGDGSKGLGYGIKDYVDLILSLEAGETIFERLIDPRLGAAKYQTQNGASSIIEDLADAGLIFIPAPGLDIEDGLQALQSKMAYNRKAPIDALNRPHFYVSDRCQNIITALQEYTADGGPDEAQKDPCDCLRYCAIAGCNFVDPQRMSTSRKTTGGY